MKNKNIIRGATLFKHLKTSYTDWKTKQFAKLGILYLSKTFKLDYKDTIALVVDWFA